MANREVEPTEGTTIRERAQRVALRYDRLGRRIWKQVETYQSGQWVVTDTRKFVWDGWRMLAELQEVEEQDQLRWAYTWGLDLAGHNGCDPSRDREGADFPQGAGTIGGLLAAHRYYGGGGSEDTIGLYCYDGNGNVGQFVDWSRDPNDAAGAIVAKYEYDPYGNVTAQGGMMVALNHFRFSTKYWDDETGLGYWGYRYYSPTLGRWISRDPGKDSGSPNLYAFVRNNPFYIDPLGLYSSDGHREITREAFASFGCRGRFVDRAVEGSVDPDYLFPLTAAYHAQSPGFVGVVSSTLSRLPSVSCCGSWFSARNAAYDLGFVMHTLQDFYSHTDWVEGGSPAMRELYRLHGYPGLDEQTRTHPAHSETLKMGLLEAGALVQVENVEYYEGSGIPGFESEHYWFAADDATQGRAMSPPNGLGSTAYDMAKAKAVEQSVAVLNWAQRRLDRCCWKEVCGN